MVNMIYFAWKEADARSATFKRWFDEADAEHVKSVLSKIVDPDGVGQAAPLMRDWICDKDDKPNLCNTGPGKNAYSISNKGIFHLYPRCLVYLNTRALKCSDLDPHASLKMRSVAFSMMHEAT